MDEFITIGQIARAVGIRGELKVAPLTDDKARFASLRQVYIASRPYRIERFRTDADFVYLKLAGVDDRTAAETLKGKFIEIDRVNAVALSEDSYFIADLIGCKLIGSDGENLGKITDIAGYGAADVFTAFDGKRTVRFPFLKKLLVSVSPEAGVIVVDRKVFDEVSVYED